jgi:hypothetical protein
MQFGQLSRLEGVQQLEELVNMGSPRHRLGDLSLRPSQVSRRHLHPKNTRFL